MGNGERLGTGNGERGMGNGERGMVGNGELGTVRNGNTVPPLPFPIPPLPFPIPQREEGLSPSNQASVFPARPSRIFIPGAGMRPR